MNVYKEKCLSLEPVRIRRTKGRKAKINTIKHWIHLSYYVGSNPKERKKNTSEYVRDCKKKKLQKKSGQRKIRNLEISLNGDVLSITRTTAA